MPIYNGEVECKGYTTAKALGTSGQRSNTIGIRTPESNTADIYVASKTVAGEEKKGFPIPKGTFFSLPIKDTSYLYVSGASGDKVYWIQEGY